MDDKLKAAALYLLAGVVTGAAAGDSPMQARGIAAVPAYYVAEIEVHDTDRYQREFADRIPATLAPYGGRYLAAGGRTQAVEGAAPLNRVAVLVFPSMEKAVAWHDSPEYGTIEPAGQATTTTTRAFIVEGGPRPQ